MTAGDGRDDDVLDLGVIGPESEEPGEPPAHGRTRWAVPVVALVAGGLLGAVIADSRHDAAELARVGIVSGAQNWTPDEGGEAGTRIELQLMNIGAQPVEIVGIEAAGFAAAADTEPMSPVEAPVGDWVSVRQDGLVADCAAAPPTELLVRIRDAGGEERTVAADQQADYGGIAMLWTSECEFGAGMAQFVGPVSFTRTDASLTVTLRLLNYSGRSVQVLRMVPMAPGMTATPPELPISLAGHGSTQVDLTWTVDDCAAATTMTGDDGRVEYTVSSGVTQLPDGYPLDGATMVELVRLVTRVCG